MVKTVVQNGAKAVDHLTARSEHLYVSLTGLNKLSTCCGIFCIAYIFLLIDSYRVHAVSLRAPPAYGAVSKLTSPPSAFP
jgi:hypothetical protein